MRRRKTRPPPSARSGWSSPSTCTSTLARTATDNAILAEVASENANVIVADWNSAVTAESGQLQPDGIHPSTTGQHLWRGHPSGAPPTSPSATPAAASPLSPSPSPTSADTTRSTIVRLCGSIRPLTLRDTAFLEQTHATEAASS